MKRPDITTCISEAVVAHILQYASAACQQTLALIHLGLQQSMSEVTPGAGMKCYF